MVAILGYSREQIAGAVRQMYGRVARQPTAGFHFPVGRDAAVALGYEREQLDNLPDATLAAFAGVGHPFVADRIQEGDTVLDIGAGAGVDALIASRLVGPRGRVIAVDLTPEMSRKLAHVASANGYDNVSAIEGSAEQLPVRDSSIDVITSNGALNLVPDKRRAVREMFRALRPGGTLQLADVVIRRPVTVDCDSDPRLWVECVVGATVDEELLDLLVDEGFASPEVLYRHDYFALSPSAQTREIAASFDAHSLALRVDRDQTPLPAATHWWRRVNPMRLLRLFWRRGAAGLASLGLALFTCYGLLAAFALLPLLGLNMALDDGLWAGGILVFTWLAVAAVTAGVRQHQSYLPLGLASLGASVVSYALLVNYNMLVEISGFALLAAGVAFDWHWRRRRQREVLGIDSAANLSRVDPD